MSRQPAILSNVIRGLGVLIAGVLALTQHFLAALGMLALGAAVVAWEFYGGTLSDGVRDVRRARTVSRRRRERDARITARRRRNFS